MKIALVMLAAGNSRRFGSNKLLYEIDGKPMYLLTLEKLKKASEKIPESEIIVVTQYEEIVKKAGEMKIPVFINPRPEDGISLSMQIGLMSVRGMPFYSVGSTVVRSGYSCCAYRTV